MDKKMLGVAQTLKQHPLRYEGSQYKKLYIGILDYFVRKYSADDIWATAMLRLYMEQFDIKKPYQYSDTQIPAALRKAFGIRFRKFSFHTFRHALIMDCFYMNCFDDIEKSACIIDYIKSITSKRYHKKIDCLYGAMYGDSDSLKAFPTNESQSTQWLQNKLFAKKPLRTILVTANMSAGKSTLINALVGKPVNRSQTEACTAKVHYIYNKPFEDGLDYEWDYLLQLNADRSALMEDNVSNSGVDISVGTYFKTSTSISSRLCLIDTPGTNFALDQAHGKIAKDAVQYEYYDVLVYVFSASQLGTDDEHSYLKYLADAVPKEKVVFVLNKLDTYRTSEDSISDSISGIRTDLINLGFENPIICPLSAYFALLIKTKMDGELLNDDEQDAFDLYAKKFMKPEYDLSSFYTIPKPDNSVSDELSVLSKKCGLYGLELTLFGGDRKNEKSLH